MTIADADFDGSAFEVAVTVTCGGLGIVVGAVYCPVEEMVPQALPVHEAPIRLHLTLVSVEPVTVAVNCWLSANDDMRSCRRNLDYHGCNDSDRRGR